MYCCVPRTSRRHWIWRKIAAIPTCSECSQVRLQVAASCETHTCTCTCTQQPNTSIGAWTDSVVWCQCVEYKSQSSAQSGSKSLSGSSGGSGSSRTIGFSGGEQTALHSAVNANDLNTVFQLLLEGVSINVLDRGGRTALHCAGMFATTVTTTVAVMVMVMVMTTTIVKLPLILHTLFCLTSNARLLRYDSCTTTKECRRQCTDQ
jgi:hypothetical protein